MWVGSKHHAPAPFPPRKEAQHPFYWRLGGPQCQSGQVQNIWSLPGFDPLTVQPVASRYNDCTIPVQVWQTLARIVSNCNIKEGFHIYIYIYIYIYMSVGNKFYGKNGKTEWQKRVCQKPFTLLFYEEKEKLGGLILSTEKLYLFFMGSSQYLEIACTGLLTFWYFPPVALQRVSRSWPPLTWLCNHIHWTRHTR